MRLGHRTAFLDLFEDETQDTQHERKGRRELTSQRNKLLAARHYFFIKIRRMQYQDALDNLVTEFHITERTIVDIFQSTNYLQSINKEKPDVNLLRKQYPHLNWQY